MIRVSKPTFYSSGLQRVHVDQKSVKINPLIVGNDPDVPSIQTDRSIVLLAPEYAIWDTSLTLLSYSGPARYKVKNFIHYTKDGKNAVFDVIRDFSSSDSVIIKDLRLIPKNVAADSSYIGLSLPMSEYPHTQNVIDVLPTKFGRTTISFPTQRFIKGRRKQTVIDKLIIAEGEHSALIDPSTDIKLVLDESIALNWHPNQSLNTTTIGLKSKVRLQDAYIDPVNGLNNVLVIPVDNGFRISDSFDITGLTIMNNSSFTDNSDVGFMSLLFGDYGSSDYYTDIKDSLILGAPKLSMESNIFFIAGNDQNYNLPDLLLKDDVIPILISDYEYHLSLPNSLNAKWVTTGLTVPSGIKEINAIGSNLIFQLTNYIGVGDSIKLEGLSLSGDFDTDSVYKLYLIDPEKKDTLAVNLNNIFTGKPELYINQKEFWLDTLIIKTIDRLVIQESDNRISPKTITLTNPSSKLFTWWNVDKIFVKGQTDAIVSLNQEKSMLTLQNLKDGSKELIIENISLKLKPDVFNHWSNIEMSFPIKIEYHSPYNVMPWSSNDSLKFKPSPIISVPTFISTSSEPTRYIELVVNPNFSDYPAFPSASDIKLIMYKPNTNDVLLDFAFNGMNVTDLNEIKSSIDTNFSVTDVHRVRFDLTDSLVTVLNKVFEAYPNGVSTRINYGGNIVSGSASTSFKVPYLTPGIISMGNAQTGSTKTGKNNSKSGSSYRDWYLDWGVINPAETNLTNSSRYYNPYSNDFSIDFDLPIGKIVKLEFDYIAADSSLPINISNIQIDNNRVKVPGSYFIDNGFSEGLYRFQVVAANSDIYAFPVVKNMLIDKTAPIVVSVWPLPGLREDSSSGHIISNADTIIFELKDTPLWNLNNSDSYSFSDSIFYRFEIVMDDLDTVFNDSGFIDIDDYSTARINYDLKEILPNPQDGHMRIQLDLNDKTGNKYGDSFLFSLRTNIGGKIIADKMFNYPNPFSSTAGDGTHIRYTLLSESSSGKLIILDSSGNLVYIYNLVSNELNAGTHTIFWDGLSIFNHRLSPGVYFGFLDFNGEIVKSKIAVIN